jgi:hypothetical protein
MRNSLIAAATLAAVTFGAAQMASAGVSTGLNGISAHSNGTLAENVYYKKRHWQKHWWHKKRWVCAWRHGHKHCWWR